MAIGDAGAAAGLIIYPNTQDIKLGFQNDNQRADDIAATMVRLKTLETNGHTADTIATTSLAAQTIPAGGTLGLGSVVVAAATYPRTIRIEFNVLADAGSAGFTDFILWDSTETEITRRRLYGLGSADAAITVALVANAAQTYQLVATPTGGNIVTVADTRYSQIRAIMKTIA
jgi:hypothetical protein